MIVKGGQIVLDGTSCMYDEFGAFISNITPMLISHDSCIVVFDKTLTELRDSAHSPNKAAASKAQKALEALTRLSHAKLLVIMNLAPGQTIVQKMQTYLGKVNQTFITQKAENARQISALNTVGSKIEVRQINKYGYLSPHKFPDAVEKPHIKPYFHIVSTEEMYQGPFTGFKSSKT